jgi:uncharacterized membrane protein
VEAVEALIIVLAVGVVRGWRSTLLHVGDDWQVAVGLAVVTSSPGRWPAT